VGARLKATTEQALAIGWHTRNLHYVKNLKPIDKYLKPPPAKAPGVVGARGAKQMLHLLMKKQEAQHGNG
jgi:hypothetical protein